MRQILYTHVKWLAHILPSILRIGLKKITPD